MINNLCNPRTALEGLVPYSGEMPAGKLVLAANESPFNLPEAVTGQLKDGIDTFAFNRYPDPLAQTLRAKIAAHNGVDPENILIGNGGDELLLDIMLAWGGTDATGQSKRRRTMLQFTPTFSMYSIYAQALETNIISIARDPKTYNVYTAKALHELEDGQIDLCFVDNPSNPSGQMMPKEDIHDLLDASDALVVVDEAYYEFSGETMLRYLDKHPNMIILRTFSKAYSLAGLRLGYVIAHPRVINMLARVRMPYSVNAFTQWVGNLVMDNLDQFNAPVAEIIQQREQLTARLRDVPGVKAWSSQANYILFRVNNASCIFEQLLDSHDIYIRYFKDGPGLENCLRVTVGTQEQNDRFIKALHAAVLTVNRQGCDTDHDIEMPSTPPSIAPNPPRLTD